MHATQHANLDEGARVTQWHEAGAHDTTATPTYTARNDSACRSQPCRVTPWESGGGGRTTAANTSAPAPANKQCICTTQGGQAGSRCGP